MAAWGSLKIFRERRFSYTSSDVSVAQVDSDGLLTSVKAGGADVTVSYHSYTATVPVLIWGLVRSIPPIDSDRLLQVSDDGSLIVLNRVMVELKLGYGPADARQVASSIGGSVIFEFRTFPGYVIEFGARTEKDLQQALAVLQADQRVAVSYPDLLVPAMQGPTPENNANIGHIGPGLDAYVNTGMGEAWPMMNGLNPANFSPVLIAVIDTDFSDAKPGDSEYEVIKNEFGTEIFVEDLVPGVREPRHGTAVTSIIVAKNNTPPISKKSFSGVVTSVDGLPYNLVFVGIGDIYGKVHDIPIISALRLINALEHLELYKHQVDVVNLSLAASCGAYCPLYDHLFNVIKSMPEVTFVAAAGNAEENKEGPQLTPKDIDNDRVIPAEFSAHLDNVISVGGLSRDGVNRHVASNYGTSVTLWAPYDVWAVDVEDPDGYGLMNGTSYSAALVSGTVALLKAVDSSLTPKKIKELLRTNRKPIAVCNSNSEHGRPEHEPEWKTLDAHSALRKAISDGVKGDIRSSRVDREVPDPLNVTAIVFNKSDFEWGFRLDAALTTADYETIVSPTCSEEVVASAFEIVPPRGTSKFMLSFAPPTQHNQWVVLRLYPFDNEAKLLHSREVVIPLFLGTPTPPAMLPANPSPTVVPTAVPSPTPGLGPGPGLVPEVPPGHSVWIYEPGDVSNLDISLHGAGVDLQRRDGVLSVWVYRQGPSSILAFIDFLDADSGVRIWRFQPTGGNYAILEGVVYADSGEGLEALDATTGERLWSYETDGGLQAVVDGTVYVDSAGGLEALDATTRERLWSYETDGGLQAVVDGTVYVDSAEILEVVDAATGENIWSHKQDGSYGSRARTRTSGVVRRVDARAGYPFWNYASDAGLREIADGVVYLWASGVLNALNATTGKRIWRHESGSLYRVKDGVAYVSQGGLSAVNAATGEPLWLYEYDDSERPDYNNISAIIDGVVYLERSGVLHAVDAATGELLWRYGHGDQRATIQFRGISAGVVYLYLFRRGTELHALNAETGELLWRRESVDWMYEVAGGVAYVGSPSHLDALDAATGEWLWGYDGSRNSYFEIAAVDGVAYVTSHLPDYSVNPVDSVYAMDAATGQQIWKYPVGLKGTVYDLGIEFDEERVYLSVWAGVDKGKGSQLSTRLFVHAIQR